MDDLEHVPRMAPDQREQQFLRLRDRKVLARELEGNSVGITLRSIDFRK